MKKTALFILLALIAQGAIAQYFPIDTARLNQSYAELLAHPNSKSHQEAFFITFPRTWMEFTMTYQYVPGKNYDLTMYFKSAEQIRALGKLTMIPDSTYCEKLIGIAVGAEWDADAPSYFKSLLHQVVQSKKDPMFKALAQLRKGNQMQFWQFYWSNIVRSKDLEKEFLQLKKESIGQYPDQVKIMSIAFDYFYDGIAIPEDYPTLFNKETGNTRF